MPFLLQPTRGPGPVVFKQSEYIQPLPTLEPLQPTTRPHAIKHEAVVHKVTSPPIIPILPNNPTKSSILLLIPLEIRRQIYEYVLEANLVSHRHLAPNPPTSIPIPITSNGEIGIEPHEKLKASFAPIGSSLPSPLPPCQDRLLPTHQHVGRIPTALLTLCRQVYSEFRTLPFESAVLCFVNWLSSGVYAARKFTRSLRPWQSDALRFVSLEVTGRDLRSSSAGGCADWLELCRLWRNLRGMKIVLKGSELEIGGRGMLDVQSEWVAGLRGIKGMRWLSVEIANGGIEDDVKRGFCKDLEDCLNEWPGVREGREGGSLRVVLVER